MHRVPIQTGGVAQSPAALPDNSLHSRRPKPPTWIAAITESATGQLSSYTCKVRPSETRNAGQSPIAGRFDRAVFGTPFDQAPALQMQCALLLPCANLDRTKHCHPDQVQIEAAAIATESLSIKTGRTSPSAKQSLHAMQALSTKPLPQTRWLTDSVRC